MDPRRGYENLPKDPFKMVEAWILSSGKRQVMGSRGR